MPLAVVAGFLCVLGALEALSLYVGAARVGRPVTLGRALMGTLPSWSLQLALVWPVLLLSRRARLGRGTWLRRLPLHALGAALFVVVTVLGTTLIFKWMGRTGDQPVEAVAGRLFFALLANQVTVYAAMVGVFHALDYFRESEQRERERARLAESLTEARLTALRSQLRPHFFFNVLNAISTFALQGRPQQVADMVGALGDLVRASLDEQLPHRVPLERELQLLDLYLGIQRARFADWLRIERHVDPAAREVLVPSLVLQPLVENAIEHGGQDDEGINRVSIRCTLQGDRISIEISNPGAPPAAGSEPRLGVGLANTRERLERLYPGNHEFRFGLEPPRGFVTSLRLPADRGPATPAGAVPS